jgi:dihydroflavonol-4-reductase
MILVTGASGFLGQHLVQSLAAKGSPVRALYNNTPPPAQLQNLEGVSWLRADLLDVYDVETAMQGITHVYHCAAIISFQPAEQEKMLHFNPESTANIVNQALEQGITKMVYISSIAALGKGTIDKPEITEEEQWGESNYSSAYGVSKYLAETEVWRGIGEGLNAVIINPGIMLGEGNFKEGSTELISIAYKEFPFYTKGVTAWVDVQDVVNAACELMASANEAERYILSCGNFPYREIFNMMAASLGKKPPRFYANTFLSGLVWRFGKLQSVLGKKPAITRETARSANTQSYYSNHKLLAALPHFSYTPMPETIERVAKTFLKTNHKN